MADPIQIKKTLNRGAFEIWEARLDGYTGELTCALPGFEFLLPPYPAQEIRKGGRVVPLSTNTVSIFNGFIGHAEKFLNAKALLKSIIISPEYVKEFCEPLNIRPQEIDFHDSQVPVESELEKQLKVLAGLSSLPLETSESSLDCFTSEVVLNVLVSCPHSSTEKILKETRSGFFPEAVPRIKAVIHKNIENPDFDLDFLAKESGISKFHLIRLFKKNVGSSPAKYLAQIKIDLAKHWLLKTKKSVLSIAMDLGFRDLSTFNKAFRRSTGLSPSEFRLRY